MEAQIRLLTNQLLEIEKELKKDPSNKTLLNNKKNILEKLKSLSNEINKKFQVPIINNNKNLGLLKEIKKNIKETSNHVNNKKAHLKILQNEINSTGQELIRTMRESDQLRTELRKLNDFSDVDQSGIFGPIRLMGAKVNRYGMTRDKLLQYNINKVKGDELEKKFNDEKKIIEERIKRLNLDKKKLEEHKTKYKKTK